MSKMENTFLWNKSSGGVPSDYDELKKQVKNNIDNIELNKNEFDEFKKQYDNKQQEQDNSLVGKQDILMWKNKPIKNIVFEDSEVCINWLNDNNNKIKVISYRGFGVHQGGYATPIPWNYISSERLWIQFNPNTGKWFWSESSNFIARNMYVLIVEYVEM